MFLTKLAFKNLVRHRKRTLITAYIIAFAIFYYIAFDSVIAGMTELSYQSIIDNEAGHLQLVTEEYWQEEDELPLENLFSVNQEMMSAVSTVDSYQASSPELSFQSRLNNGMNELPVVGKGVVPDRFTEVFDIEQQFVNGEMFSAGENRVVMGKGLADLMKLSVGDYIILLVKDKNNTFNTIEAEVSGLIHTGNPNVNRNIVYLPLDIVQQALNVDKQISKLIVRLEDKDLAVNTEKQIEESFFHMGISGENYLNVYRWDQLEAVSVAGAKQAANNMIMFIILLIAAIAIINMVILAALERMKEIGMMKAMGLKVKEIIYIFVLESTGIGVLGGIIGIVMGVVAVCLLSRYGIDFGAIMDIDMSRYGIPVVGKLYGVWNPWSFVKVFSFGVIASILASILPAYWAADKDPIKAIYHI